ncbi:helix-turn-helix domain-containing protein [Mesorhizobium australicum]|uniref:Transcriptional regulator, XRE family with cupin sensor n=1 Tax=Mesorhizobium australicum TaxID=536018 RepID=A0A1X7PW03_9HYPH|nr:transcriptional regulator, XRE family with cupin sensor [Mesorhizobium australicum]
MDSQSAEGGVRGLDHDAFGERLRTRRRELGLTLKEVADGAGLSVGFISQIERGITTPSLSSLVSVSRVLGFQVSEFLSQPRVIAPTTRHDQRPHYAIGSNSLVYERLSTSFPGNVINSVIIHEPPGYRSEPIAHEGEEIFYVLEGGITVEVDGETHVLGVGDSIHFPSRRVHSSWNHTSTPSTILHTCTMDVFRDNEANSSSNPGAVTASELPPKPKTKTTSKAKKGKSS